MATIVSRNGREEVPDSDPRIQAYNALYKAAERIGRGNYQSSLYKPYPFRKGRGLGYRITEAHEDIIKAMPKVLSGEITPDEAMALLHRGDVFEQRLRG